MTREPDPSLLGRTIAGKFLIESVIGGGAMGAVFRARQVVLDKAIAIKVLHREISRDPSYAARFLREAKAASRIDHPASVRVIDFGEEPDGLLYLAMELLDGRDLFTVLREDGPLDQSRVGDIVLQVLAAAAVAHETGVVHRDIKPENIMIQRGTDDEGRPRDIVKVCDFGVAKITDKRGDKNEAAKSPAPAITTEGLVVGTPEYMSPEQGRGEPLDARSDLYSIGIILYQMLAGRVPFEAESALGIVLKHVTEDPVPPTKLRAEIDPKLEAVCMRALQKKREARYQTAREMRAELRAALSARDGDAAKERTITIEQTSSALAPRTIIGVGEVKATDTPPVGTADTAVAFDSSVIRAIQASDERAAERRGATDLAATLGTPRPRMGGIVVGGSLLVVALGAVGLKLATVSRTPPPVASSAPIASVAPMATLSVAPPNTGEVPVPEPTATHSAEHAKAATHKPGPVASVSSVGASASSPVASGAPVAAPAAGGRIDPRRGKVTIGGVRALGVPPEAVRKEVPETKILHCYRTAIAGLSAAPKPLSLVLHVDANDTGKIHNATLSGSPSLSKEASTCVTRSMMGKTISSEGANLVSADIDLGFSVD
jgi:serine/threonine-protein kinase